MVLSSSRIRRCKEMYSKLRDLLTDIMYDIMVFAKRNGIEVFWPADLFEPLKIPDIEDGIDDCVFAFYGRQNGRFGYLLVKNDGSITFKELEAREG
jgi:hypothetical protein